MTEQLVEKIRKIDAGLAIPVEPTEQVDQREPVGVATGSVLASAIVANDYRLAAFYLAREPDEDWEHPTSSSAEAETVPSGSEPLSKPSEAPTRRVRRTPGSGSQEQRRG